MARCFYHPLGEQTAYTYDLAGRVLTEDHSDRGLTTTTYDKASNVMEISTPATQSFGGSITMDYNFNRLVSRLMPNSSGMDLYDIQYTYGYKGDGRNGAGRVVKVEQGQTFKIDDLRYDELGQSAEEVVSIDVPMQGGRMFTTRKFYDSFGRILQAGYPDGDKVDYQYNALGELSGINSILGGVTQPIITAISYNGYGQISLLTYGNGTSTTYSYASGNTKKATTLMSSAVTGKEQGGVSPTTLLSRQYAYNKQGMVAAMDRSIAGSLLSQSSVVNYHDSYSYDAFGRLEGHHQLNGTTPQYDLTMSYNKAGGITFKDGNGNGFMNAQSLNYNLEYGYSPAKPHQLEQIWDADNAITTQFQYNTSGSITQIDDPSQGIPQEFYWNEAQQLTGVKNQQGVHHYIYDHQGERIMKSSLITSTVYLNDQVIDDVNNLDPYTVYVNPFYVVTGFMGGDRVSKHYYMNQQRVATDISINYDPNGNGGAEAQGASPRANAQNLALVDLLKVLRALEQPELDTTALTLPRMESVYPELQPSSTTSTALTENITNRILFWYHPDYLGNVDLVTEKDGYAYEFFVYTPWGEEMHQWNANTFNFSSPYRFNGKELDPETGLAYYGARYYQNKIGVWLSVDAIVAMDHSTITYGFSHNNPIMLVDPDGNWPKWFESVVSNVGNAFSNSWSSMKKVFQKNTETFYSALEEITVIAYVKVDIGVQVGINSPYCSAKINASSIELFSGGVDLTSRESFIENTIADEGAIVRQEISGSLRLPSKLSGDRELSIAGRIGQVQRVTDKNGWIENEGYTTSGHRTYSDASFLVPIVKSNPSQTGPLGYGAPGEATVGSEFKGINLGLGLTCLLGFEINLKMGYNEQE